MSTASHDRREEQGEPPGAPDAVVRTTAALIAAYLDAQPDRLRDDLRTLDELMQRTVPNGRRWFVDGTDAAGRVVSNPSIGYGEQTMRYADGSTRPFYQLGLSANTAGISVYIMGRADRSYLARTYGATIGAATVTGYCIKFRRLAQIDIGVLEAALRDGVAHTST